MAVIPLAECMPLLLDPASMTPVLVIFRSVRVRQAELGDIGDEITGNGCLGNDPLAARVQAVEERTFLVRIHIAGESIVQMRGLARSHSQAAKVALPTIFCPAASPVVKLKRKNKSLPAV